MKILITSGGTKVAIDPVRSITNMSKGTFGSKIAKTALDCHCEVYYLISEGGRSPFTCSPDFYNMSGVDDVNSQREWCNEVRDKYTEVRYNSFSDYKQKLKEAINTWKPNVIILAAAVSDYITTPHSTKIRTSDQLTIHLEPAEKIISNVRTWAPNSYIVGFKLLVDAKTIDLQIDSLKSIRDNDCDMVVANDLKSLKSGNHNILITKRVDLLSQMFSTMLPETIVTTAISGYNDTYTAPF